MIKARGWQPHSKKKNAFVVSVKSKPGVSQPVIKGFEQLLVPVYEQLLINFFLAWMALKKNNDSFVFVFSLVRAIQLVNHDRQGGLWEENGAWGHVRTNH